MQKALRQIYSRVLGAHVIGRRQVEDTMRVDRHEMTHLTSRNGDLRLTCIDREDGNTSLGQPVNKIRARVTGLS